MPAGSSTANAIMVIDSDDDDGSNAGAFITAPSTRAPSASRGVTSERGFGAQNDGASTPNATAKTTAEGPSSSKETSSKGKNKEKEKNTKDTKAKSTDTPPKKKKITLHTRPYQHELLALSLRQNVIIALDTGAGKTHVAVLRVKAAVEADSAKLAWFLAPTVALAAQQHAVLTLSLPFPAALLSGAAYPDQWKSAALWDGVVKSHRVVVSTPQILLDALRHGYVSLGRDIGLLVFDEAHHCVEKHPYRMIMSEFYFQLPPRPIDAVGAGVAASTTTTTATVAAMSTWTLSLEGNGKEEKEKERMICRPAILGLTASPIYGSGDVDRAFRAIESNLDSLIVTPSEHTRASLAQHVHRPVFKHIGFFRSPSTLESDAQPQAQASSYANTYANAYSNAPSYLNPYLNPYSTPSSNAPSYSNPRPDTPAPFSTNLAALQAVISGLDIERDPYVKGLRAQVEKLRPASAGAPMSREYVRVDQKLSKVLTKEDSFTHKGLKDFGRAAVDILDSLGSWACDWYVWTVVERARMAANPFGAGGTNALGMVARTWRNQEKRYLSKVLASLTLSPPSYYEDDIIGECSDKVRVLIEALLDEKEEAESYSHASGARDVGGAGSGDKDGDGDGGDEPPKRVEPEGFSGLVFVQRRDAVLALAELLNHHPATKDAFKIATLLGSSDSLQRHAFMDITKTIVPGERGGVAQGMNREGSEGERVGEKEGEEERKEKKAERGAAAEMEDVTGKAVEDVEVEEDTTSAENVDTATSKDKGKGKGKGKGHGSFLANAKGKRKGKEKAKPEPPSQPPKPHSAKAQQAVLAEFRSGEKNLIISTAVAEEGIDIQACGCVVRWDPPPNMASWVQSRGRARRKRSTFVLLYDVEEDKAMGNVEKWRRLEEEMVAESQMRVARFQEEGAGIKGGNGEEGLGEDGREEVGDWDQELKSEETGATINPHSAVSHLSHFCSIISRSGGEDNQPIYDLDPPDYPIAHHTSPNSTAPTVGPSKGPWSSTVHLPRSLPIPKRAFSTLPTEYPTKLAAHRHAAFQAYKSLQEWGLLNENLLPLGTGEGLGEEEEEVKRVLAEIDKREGLVGVSVQVDPWRALGGEGEKGVDVYNADAVVAESGNGGVAGNSTPTTHTGEKEKKWYLSTMEIDGLPPLLLFTLRPMGEVSREEGPELYRAGQEVTRVSVTPRSSIPPGVVGGILDEGKCETVLDGEDVVRKAREYTRMVFWCFGNTRMDWENLDFAYLFLPVSSYPELLPSNFTSNTAAPVAVAPLLSVSSSTSSKSAAGSVTWVDRRQQLFSLRESGLAPAFRADTAYLLPGDIYTSIFGHSEDMVIVRKHSGQGRPLRFVGWQWDNLGEEGEERVREEYGSKRKRKEKESEKTVLEEKTNGHAVKDRADAMDVDKVDGEKVDVVMQEVKEEDEAKLEIIYPLLIVEPFPPRSNFLVPLPDPPQDDAKANVDEASERKSPTDLRTYLLPSMSAVAFYAYEEVEYAFLLPSILRWLGNNATVASFQQQQWTFPSPSPLLSIPRSLLTVALTAPVSGEHYNYQRLETLGDAVLKFVVGVQLYAEYPMWHEGYLTRAKDHAVSNVKLAKECFKRGVFKWIVRDRLLGKKWAPRYASVESGKREGKAVRKESVVKQDVEKEVEEKGAKMDTTPDTQQVGQVEPTQSENTVDATTQNTENTRQAVDKAPNSKASGKRKKKGKGKSQELSTKVLADVVEALIGSAYEHGGFDLGYECIKFFDLGVKWQPLSSRLTHVIANIRPDTEIGTEIPSQIGGVESMIGYTFQHKILLVEALTHSSYRDNVSTISYERLEFLGDSILDMVATDYLYHAPGKKYSPGHMHIRKSAVVNGHFLAYICLGLKYTSRGAMPLPILTDEDGDLPRNPYAANVQFEQGIDEQEIYLWQCLLHSNQGVLDAQTNTFTRYEKWGDTIRHALENETVFPWAALTRLQAPKFFSDIVEAIVGAVYLDSGGNMDTIRNFLRGIGILPVLERIVAADVDVFHPVSRVAMWATKNQKEVEFVFEHEKGDISCVLLVDGEEEVRETERYRGMTSQEEVKYAAAEKAIKQFNLRDAAAGTGIGDRRKKVGAKPKRKRVSE